MIGRRRQPTSNQLSVDNDRCHRYGFCVAEAPELFELTASGGLRYRKTVPDAELDDARSAVRLCPTVAIALTEARNTTTRGGRRT
jgi:ferredoxin